jgi:hypothetical protein
MCPRDGHVPKQLGCRTYILLPFGHASSTGYQGSILALAARNTVRRRSMNKEEAAVAVIIVLSCPVKNKRDGQNKCLAQIFNSDTARATSFEAIFSQFFLTSSSIAVGFVTSS